MSDDADYRAKHGLSDSVVTDFGAERKRVALVTFAVLTGAASYILMLFVALPLSIHLIYNQQERGCDPEVQDDCFAPTDGSQRQLTLTLSLLRTMTFVMGSFVGTLSDKVGRRPLLIGALAGYAVTGALFLVGWVTEVLPLFILGGMILGASSPITPHGVAYVSDISRHDRLAANMGLLQGGGYFLGLLTGALLALAISEGTVGQDEDPNEAALAPYDRLFYISYSTGLVFAGSTALITLLFLPESLADSQRIESLNWKKANPFGFVAIISQNMYLFFLWLSAFFAWMAVGAGEAVTGGWWLRRYTITEVNQFIIFIVLVWLASALGAAFMTRVLVTFGGLKKAIHFGMVFTIAIGVALAFSPTADASYSAVALSFFGAPVVPTTLALIMGQVPANEKGALAGALRSSEALAKLIGILLFGSLFANYIEEYRPDISCVPLDYGITTQENSCPCGVETCPTFDGDVNNFNSSGRVLNPAFPFYYEAAKCTLGQLSPAFAGKYSSYVPFVTPEPEPIVPQLFVDLGIVTRPDTCTGGGGRKSSLTLELDRQWCVSEAATGSAAFNAEFGCGPGFDFALAAADRAFYESAGACANLTSPDCNLANAANAQQFCVEALPTFNISACSATYSQEQFVGTIVPLLLNITNPDVPNEDACAAEGLAELNFCWRGVATDLPGLFPLIMMAGLGALSYMFFIIAEVFFVQHDKKYWRLNGDGEVDPDGTASVMPGATQKALD